METDLKTELHSIREDLERMRAFIEAQTYQDHLHAIDDMANEQAGMTKFERNYFDRDGKIVPAALVRLSDWWRKFRWRNGF